MTLSVGDFSRFHQAVHGNPAFSWQERLLVQVVSQKRWPRVLDLPTGAGKTTCIDIALFALALDAVDGRTSWCPRRIAMVVDRRIVVDQVAERGRRILQRLVAEDPPEVVAEVARRLCSLSRTATEPLGVFTLRGGMPRDDGWARTPDQPLVLASTVDQIGSRMLVQGYGVSQGMKPVHAGLVANDTLVLLDEVHLSRPFAETLDQMAALRERFASNSGLSSRFDYALLSATHQGQTAEPFRLQPEEKQSGSALGVRLHAKKPVRLEAVAQQEDPASRAHVERACFDHAQRLLERHDVVGVVVNRVASAINVAKALEEALGDAAVVVPLTGRMRPLDRDDVLRSLRPRIATGRNRSTQGGKVVVVGTQCIEAGADFDFDALVSEAASLDALRQRFGRVDRLGRYAKSEGVVVYDRKVKDDPVYGGAIAKTIAWLLSKIDKRAKTVDFGVLALPLPEGEDLVECLAPTAGAPVLMPAYLDLWMQTSPPPAVVPDASLWLHGPRSGPADIQVVWRTDLEETSLVHESGATLAGVVGAVPPSSLEAVSLPFAVARQWLAGLPSPAASDVEGGESEVRDARNDSDDGRLALRWAGDESRAITPSELFPGDTIIVPASRGGLWRGCFDGGATVAVLDVAERAALFGKGLPLLRLHPSVVAEHGLPSLPEDAEEARATLTNAAALEPTGWRKLWLTQLGTARGVVVNSGRRSWIVLRGRRISARRLRGLLGTEESVEEGIAHTTDEEASPHAGRPVSLDAHSADVESIARRYAKAVGLHDRLVEDIALAGWLHDIGKADRRFQVMLRGGSEVSYYRDETVWAKSGMAPDALAEHRLARQRSGYPIGARHEVQSLAMVEGVREELACKANDLDLVLHLVASHHGFCRPFAPAVVDEAPIEVELSQHTSTAFGAINFPRTSSANELHRLDSPLADRFWLLVEKYGWLELCWLEAILRLADHRASEEEQDPA